MYSAQESITGPPNDNKDIHPQKKDLFFFWGHFYDGLSFPLTNLNNTSPTTSEDKDTNSCLIGLYLSTGRSSLIPHSFQEPS